MKLAARKLKQEIPSAERPTLEAELAKCKTDPARFNETILCRGPYWHRQREICESVVKYPITCVKTGNGVGKSFVDSGIAWWFACLHQNSKTVIAAPTQQQLANVLWAEMLDAQRIANKNGIYLGGKVSGLSVRFGPNWLVEGFGSGSTESRSGRHAFDLLAIIDEASGVAQSVHEAIDSLNPSKRLYTGNPISPQGKFFELCESAGRNPNVNVIEISSLESPHAHLERSGWGMADKGFIDKSRYEYGEDSLWWLVHILGKFPTELMQALLPREWVRQASLVIPDPDPRDDVRFMAVDIAKGNNGDPSGILVRNGVRVIAYEESPRWSFGELANRVKQMQAEHGVESPRIIYDATAIGTDFANRLAGLKIVGVRDYMGSRSGSEKFFNLRSEAGWALRRRLDPSRVTPVGIDRKTVYQPQRPFSIPQHLVQRFRAELEGVRYDLDDKGRIQVEAKELFMARLKKSPTFLDCLFMSFAYPNA